MAAVIAVVFWTQSRVPALNEKAQMGARTDFSAIAFDVLLPVHAEQSTIQRVFRSTVNWAYTNWKGMTFGLLFAAAVLTLLGGLAQRSFKRPWMNVLSGLLIGAPMGVCVNCATPIAQGMYAAGARLETALAVLISSPALNVIVLSMSFTLLPWKIAAINVVGVFLLLCFIPLLSQRFTGAVPPTANSTEVDGPQTSIIPPATTLVLGMDSYGNAILAVGKDFVANLIFIVRLALPFMLLAGFLGTVIIEVVPFDRFTDLEPTLPVLLAVAIVATAIPVPMAFNVIVVMALLAMGMHPGIAIVFLFALSVYSIYPAIIIGRYISISLSAGIAGLVASIATLLGVSTTVYFDYRQGVEWQAISAGIQAPGQAAYKRAVAVCQELPELAHLACFKRNIKQFETVVELSKMCHTCPSGVDFEECQQSVNLFRAIDAAKQQDSIAPCSELNDPADRSQCEFSYALSSAVGHHDISECGAVAKLGLKQACRDQYLNKRLRFNPDESVCHQLEGQELTDCKTNAAIYRFADTLDFSGCASLHDVRAQAYCRYTTASIMIARSNNSSGCSKIESEATRRRCKSLVAMWEAQRNQSFTTCESLEPADLRRNCWMRVARARIESVVTEHILTLSPPATDPSLQRNGLAESVSIAELSAKPLVWETVHQNGLFYIESTPYQKRTNKHATRFEQHTAADLGIKRNWNFQFTDFFEPFIVGKGIASGDFNNDVWPDLVLASERGALLYKNIGGRFALIDVEQGDLVQENLFLVALVDADGNGTQDLFASVYGGRNYILFNLDGVFGRTRLVKLPGDQRLTLAAGFADLDRNGELDIVLGNWSSGVEKWFAPEQSANAVLFRNGGRYEQKLLPGLKGETLSILVTDINNDQQMDILVANDRTIPDSYYFGRTNRRFELISRAHRLFDVTSMNTMSLEVADFNNDLRFDLFSTDMTFARGSREDYCADVPGNGTRKACCKLVAAYAVFDSGNATDCAGFEPMYQQQACYAVFAVKAAKNLKDPSYCNKVPKTNQALRSLCLHLAKPIPKEPSIDQSTYISQAQRNVLLRQEEKGFRDRGREMGVDSSFWSWNAKAVDLDNDGWQDIYIGNGFHFGDSFYGIQENVLFHNLGGERFEEVGAPWGLNDPINTPSYTLLDLDLDGDMDIVATGVLSPPRVFINQNAKNHSISFMLTDDSGHKSAIGSVITINYGEGRTLRQLKQLKLSGGFMSFDQPVLQFGLGKHQSISGFSVQWPDGKVTKLNTSLAAGRVYRVRRLCPKQ